MTTKSSKKLSVRQLTERLEQLERWDRQRNNALEKTNVELANIAAVLGIRGISPRLSQPERIYEAVNIQRNNLELITARMVRGEEEIRYLRKMLALYEKHEPLDTNDEDDHK